MIKKFDNLPDEDKVIRNVPWKKLRRDEDENVIGLLPIAFELRPDKESSTGWEESLSVNWAGYFVDPETSVRDCIWAMRRARPPGGKSAFAIGKVGVIKQVCSARGSRVRVIYEPEQGNPSHAGIRRLPPNDLSLMDALAAEAFAEMVMNGDIPQEPKTIV